MIKHSFAKEKETIELFRGTKDINEFKRKLSALSKSLPKTNPKLYRLKSDTTKNENRIKGKGFELFSELFVFRMGYSPHVGLANYVPVENEADNGIDARAINLNKEEAAVQCKFVSNASYEFTDSGSNLGSFINECYYQKIDWDAKIKRLFLITTAKGLHYNTEEKWRKSVYVIGIDILKTLTDNNILFWESCADILTNINATHGIAVGDLHNG